MIGILIWALVGLQLWALLYALFKGKNPWDVLWGFSIWGVIPVIILNMIDASFTVSP